MKNKQSVPVLIPFLILVSMLFIGILIFAYVETKKANPEMIEVRARDRERASVNLAHDLHALRLPSGDAAFCCAGCENVYAILMESGVVAAARISARPISSGRASDWV